MYLVNLLGEEEDREGGRKRGKGEINIKDIKTRSKHR